MISESDIKKLQELLDLCGTKKTVAGEVVVSVSDVMKAVAIINWPKDLKG